MYDKINTKTQGVCLISQRNIKNMEKNPIDSCPVRIITIGLESCSKIFQGILKALEHGNKMFQKFEETRPLKKLEIIYSPIARQNINSGIK